VAVDTAAGSERLRAGLDHRGIAEVGWRFVGRVVADGSLANLFEDPGDDSRILLGRRHAEVAAKEEHCGGNGADDGQCADKRQDSHPGFLSQLGRRAECEGGRRGGQVSLFNRLPVFAHHYSLVIRMNELLAGTIIAELAKAHLLVIVDGGCEFLPAGRWK
jgi:hypothetical protein